MNFWCFLFTPDYDNMCNVTRLRLLRGPLALPEPFSTIFLDVQHVIDDLHIKSVWKKLILNNWISWETFGLLFIKATHVMR